MKPKLKSQPSTFIQTQISAVFLLLLTLYLFTVTPSLAQKEEQEDVVCPQYACPSVICDLKKKDVQNFCSTVKCVGIHPENCSAVSEEGGRLFYEEHLSMCGCCPGCVKYLGENSGLFILILILNPKN